MEEADFFSDEEFLDQIPDNTLLELEKNAISSTQKADIGLNQPLARPRPRLPHNASSLNRSRSINTNIPWRPPQRVNAGPRPSQSVPEPPSQQYAYEDEAVINLDDSRAVEWSQSQNIVQQPRGPVLKQRPTLDPETAAAFAAADAELSRSRPPIAPPVERQHLSPIEIDFQARIKALEAEAFEARQSAEQARRALEAKSGEIAIVRANVERQRREDSTRLQELQRCLGEEQAKNRLRLEAARKEQEKLQTDNRFLQHDLAQEAERVKRLNGPGKTRTAERHTPGKARRHGLGDGFSDDEVQTYSPSRSREKARDGTPRAGAKRKRSAQDSPIASLVFAKPSPVPREESMDSVRTVQTVPLVDTRLASLPDNFESTRFMQRLLDYKPLGQHSQTFEILAQHRIPTTNDRPLSSILMQALSMQRFQQLTMPLQVISVMAQTWQQCLELQQYSSLSLVVDIIRFAISQELPSRVNSVVNEIVPLCLRSLEIVTMPIVRAHLKASYSTSIENATDDSTRAIDADQIAGVLEQTCQACTLTIERTQAFWHLMDFTNSMLLLHKALPMYRVLLGLRILHTSILPNSFGALHEDVDEQEQREKDTVYRLTFAFFDIPSKPAEEAPYNELEICELRLLLLEVLTALCQTDHGSLLLAKHVHFIGHLVRFIDEQIRKLYRLLPSISQDDKEMTDEIVEHASVVQTVNMAMRILHYLLTTHGEVIDLSEKFSVIPGGYHRFLVAMTRLAFIDQQPIYEAGIEVEVIDAAHSILDAFLTPEDGEAVAQALETPQASKSATTSRMSNPIDNDTMDTG